MTKTVFVLISTAVDLSGAIIVITETAFVSICTDVDLSGAIIVITETVFDSIYTAVVNWKYLLFTQLLCLHPAWLGYHTQLVSYLLHSISFVLLLN